MHSWIGTPIEFITANNLITFNVKNDCDLHTLDKPNRAYCESYLLLTSQLSCCSSRWQIPLRSLILALEREIIDVSQWKLKVTLLHFVLFIR